jgi:hypothetical protein
VATYYGDSARQVRGIATYTGHYSPQEPSSDCGDCGHPANHHSAYGCVTGDEGGITCVCKITLQQVVQQNCDHRWHTSPPSVLDEEPCCPECGDTP